MAATTLPGAAAADADRTRAAAAAFTTLPLMVYFLLLQRQLSRGALAAAGSIR